MSDLQRQMLATVGCISRVADLHQQVYVKCRVQQSLLTGSSRVCNCRECSSWVADLWQTFRTYGVQQSLPTHSG